MPIKRYAYKLNKMFRIKSMILNKNHERVSFNYLRVCVVKTLQKNNILFDVFTCFHKQTILEILK